MFRYWRLKENLRYLFLKCRWCEKATIITWGPIIWPEKKEVYFTSGYPIAVHEPARCSIDDCMIECGDKFIDKDWQEIGNCINFKFRFDFKRRIR